MSLYGGILAMIAAAGVWLAMAGWRGQPIRVRERTFPQVNHRQAARSGGIAVAAFVIVWAATGWPAAGVALAAVAVMAPLFVEAHRQRRLAMERTEALASWAEMLRDTISAHAGLHQAITASAAVAPSAIRGEVRRLAIRSSQMPLTRALRMFAADMADPVSDLIVAALTIADRHQAQNLPRLLSGVATATREQSAMRLRVEATRARTYASARALVVITLVMVVVLMLMSPEFMEPYDSVTGQLVLLLVGGLFAGAVWALMVMSRPIPVPRVLAGIEDLDSSDSAGMHRG